LLVVLQQVLPKLVARSASQAELPEPQEFLLVALLLSQEVVVRVPEEADPLSWSQAQAQASPGLTFLRKQAQDR
jgi:hypothetical protein